ncbi:MAG: heme ABC exporter ATP-binding protein CcmA [Candidatus Rokuibacteriota bacterium]
MVPLIRVADLRKRYGVHFVLDGVSLDVHPGEALALLGANGAGKTTLLRIVATLVRPSGGAVLVAGHDCVKEAERVRREVGYVAHGSHLYEDLTAAENLRFWTELTGNPVAREAILGALATVELETVADDKVRTFSAGMQRRLSLARLLLVPPRVLLLDEPFASLDQRAAKWLEEHLLARKAGGAGIVMSTHSFGRELDVADRVAVLAEGRVAAAVRREGLTVDQLRRLYAWHVEGQA